MGDVGSHIIYESGSGVQPSGVKAGGQGLKPSAANSHVEHVGIHCDGALCGSPPNIIGDRYKCLVCADYDLCASCRSQGVHNSLSPPHVFVRIPRPEDARRIIQEARGALNVPTANGGQVTPIGGPMVVPVSPPPVPGGMPPSEDPMVGMGGLSVHAAVACDGCGVSPVLGTRYKCMEASCPDFDLCTNCYNQGVSCKDHEPTHRMLGIASPEDAEHLGLEPEGDEDNELAIGLRVYTKSDCETAIKAQLRHGKVIRWRNDHL
ncbi:hypothetical protein DL93DRAFT_2075586 [Clavulina sp. PMI_390]|nr:hypothetical protein DL93DRAFT_2075586 [Clavulina sp. PMI_390]